jgi:hypothetical protein
VLTPLAGRQQLLLRAEDRAGRSRRRRALSRQRLDEARLVFRPAVHDWCAQSSAGSLSFAEQLSETSELACQVLRVDAKPLQETGMLDGVNLVGQRLFGMCRLQPLRRWSWSLSPSAGLGSTPVAISPPTSSGALPPALPLAWRPSRERAHPAMIEPRPRQGSWVSGWGADGGELKLEVPTRGAVRATGLANGPGRAASRFATNRLRSSGVVLARQD